MMIQNIYDYKNYDADDGPVGWDLSLDIINTMNSFTANHTNETSSVEQTEQSSVFDDESESPHENAESSNRNFPENNMDEIMRVVNDPNYKVNLNVVKFKHELKGIITHPHFQLKLGSHNQKELWITPPATKSTEPAPSPFKANKTYINSQRDQFISDILTSLFYIDISSIPTSILDE